MTGINMSNNFNLNAPIPIDSRSVVENVTERNALPAVQRYEGLLVYVKNEKKFYSLLGGISNSHWSDITAGKEASVATPEEFGAKGDGIANDTEAIQRAIDHVSNQGGGTVKFSRGTYIIHPIYMAPNVILQGAGIDVTIIKYADDGPRVGTSTRMFSMATNNAVRDLTMNGNWEAHQDGSEHMHCIFIYDESHVLVERCRLHNARGDGISITGSTTKSHTVTVRDCYIHTNHRSQIVIEAAENLKIINNYIEGTTCIHFEPHLEVNLYDAVITGNTLKSDEVGSYVVSIRGSMKGYMYHNIVFSDNYIDSPNSRFLLGWVDNCIITNNNFKAITEIHSWYDNTNVSITNNMINSSGYGLRLTAGDRGDGFEKPKDFTISDNTIICASDGIYIASGENFKITNNKIISTTGTGSGVYTWASYSTIGVYNIHVLDNEISNFKFGFSNASYQSSPTENVAISRNIFRKSPIDVQTQIINFVIDSNTFIGDATGIAIYLYQIGEQRNIMVTNNIFRDWAQAFLSRPYNFAITNVVVSNNIIQGMTAVASGPYTNAPIEFYRYGDQPVDVSISGNVIKDYAAAVPLTITVPYSDIDESKFLAADYPTLFHNKAGGWVTGIYSEDKPTEVSDAQFGFQGEGAVTRKFYVGFGANAWDSGTGGGAILNVFKDSVYVNGKAYSHETGPFDDDDTLVTKGYVDNIEVDTTAHTFRKIYGSFSMIAGRITLPAATTAGAGWREATKQIAPDGFTYLVSIQTTVKDDDYAADQVAKVNAKLGTDGLLTVRAYVDYSLSINTTVDIYYTAFVIDHSV